MSAPILVKLCLSLSLSFAQSLSFSGSLAPGQNSCFAPEALWVWVAVAMPPVMADVLFPYVNIATGNTKENNNTVATKLKNNNTISLGQTEDVCVVCAFLSACCSIYTRWLHKAVSEFTVLWRWPDRKWPHCSCRLRLDWINTEAVLLQDIPFPPSCLTSCLFWGGLAEKTNSVMEIVQSGYYGDSVRSLSLSLSECSCQLVEKTSSLFGRDEWTLEILSRKQSSKHNIQRIILVYFNLPYLPLMCLSIMTVSLANFALWRHRKTKSQTKWHKTSTSSLQHCNKCEFFHGWRKACRQVKMLCVIHT